jgi:chitinase
VPSPTGSNQKTVIGYYASWQWYDREKFADPANVDFSKYDRINYAFFQPSPDGYIYGTDEWADSQLLWGPYTWGNGGEEKPSWDAPNYKKYEFHDTSKGLVTLAHQAGTEVMPSIGGWTLSNNFPVIAADATLRTRFAQQCKDLARDYDFDGVDIDWEYPGYADHDGTPQDRDNYILLLQAVKDQLAELSLETGKSYGLTAALPCGPDKIKDIHPDIKNVLTELNLMTYDLHGAWDALTGTNAPMFDQGWGDSSKRWSVHGCVNNYVEMGVPLSQMNIGLPFYGRSVKGATGMKQFHGGADDINFHLDEGSPQYFNIVNELKRMTTYRHANTQTQYAAFDDGGMVSYDDPRAICDKVHYANQRGMHGFLIWEISGDMIQRGNQVLTPLIDATNAKIADPEYDCSLLRDPLWAMRDTSYRMAPPEPESVDWNLYQGPVSTGSDNDFSGAQESRPAPSPTGNEYNSPNNGVYSPTNSNAGGNSGGSPGNSGSAPSPTPGVKDAPTWSDLDEGDDCPPDYDGYFPTPECSGYVYCQGGAVVGASQPCVPGTKFDLAITACAYESNVQCGR